ncbi:DivIVA domain-containing protein [Pseudoclavibacter endophyticus]
MRSDDIVNQRFSTTRFGAGYDQREVDTFLEKLTAALRRLETGDHLEAGGVNSEEVINVRFTPSRFRVGYDAPEVDEFLDRIVIELRRREGVTDPLEAASARG